MNELNEIFDSEDLNDIDFGETQETQETQIDFSAETEDSSDFFSDNSEFTNEDDSKNTSVLDKFLQSKGFIDSKIKVVDDNNEETEVEFSELSEEEQLDILNSFSASKNTNNLNLLDEEQALLSELRENNLSMSQFLDMYKQSIIEEAKLASEPSYEIDEYDDKELFLLDLKNKYDLSDEELQLELEKELQNEDLFNKKVSKLRSEYKELEEQYKANEQSIFEEQQQQQYSEFVNQISNIAETATSFHGLELEDEEINNTLSYLLDLNDQGVSQFYHDLNNPEKLYEIAWYLKYGKDAFKTIEDAYETEIAKLKTNSDKPKVVRQVNNKNNIKTIDDIF